jgi:hypothetical protein
MFLVDPKVFRFVVKGVKAIFLGVQSPGQVHGARKERIIIITRYDYNLTIMKSPKPATDAIYPQIKF